MKVLTAESRRPGKRFRTQDDQQQKEIAECLLESGDYLQSGVAAAGGTAYALGRQGMYAMNCR